MTKLLTGIDFSSYKLDYGELGHSPLYRKVYAGRAISNTGDPSNQEILDTQSVQIVNRVQVEEVVKAVRVTQDYKLDYGYALDLKPYTVLHFFASHNNLGPCQLYVTTLEGDVGIEIRRNLLTSLKQNDLKENNLVSVVYVQGLFLLYATTRELLLEEGSLDDNKFVPKSITGDKIKSVDGQAFEDQTLTTAKFKDRSIDGVKVKKNSLFNEVFQDGGLTGKSLMLATLTDLSFKDETLTDTAFGTGALPASSFDAPITDLEIADGTVEGRHFASHILQSSKIKNGAVSGPKFSLGAITTSKVHPLLNGSILKDGAITSNHFIDGGIGFTSITSDIRDRLLNSLHQYKIYRDGKNGNIDGDIDLLCGTFTLFCAKDDPCANNLPASPDTFPPDAYQLPNPPPLTASSIDSNASSNTNYPSLPDTPSITGTSSFNADPETLIIVDGSASMRRVDLSFLKTVPKSQIYSVRHNLALEITPSLLYKDASGFLEGFQYAASTYATANTKRIIGIYNGFGGPFTGTLTPLLQVMGTLASITIIGSLIDEDIWEGCTVYNTVQSRLSAEVKGVLTTLGLSVS